MSEKKKVVRTYISGLPGLTLTLKGVPANVRFKPSAPGPNRIGVFSTDDEKVQKLLEAHPRFKEGTIYKQPTLEEIEAEKKAKEVAEMKNNLDKFFSAIGGVPDFTKLKKDQLEVAAELVGIETKGKTADALAKEIENILKMKEK